MKINGSSFNMMKALNESAKDELEVKKQVLMESNKVTINESTWAGVPNTKHIWNGEWSDPQVEYKGLVFNEYDLQEWLNDDYNEDVEDQSKVSFEDWVKEHNDEVYGVLESLYPDEVAGWVLDKIDNCLTSEELNNTLNSFKQTTLIPDKVIDELLQMNDSSNFEDEEDRLYEITPEIIEVLENKVKEGHLFESAKLTENEELNKLKDSLKWYESKLNNLMNSKDEPGLLSHNRDLIADYQEKIRELKAEIKEKSNITEACFDDKVKAIKKSLKKKDKRLSDKSAETSAKKIAGSMKEDNLNEDLAKKSNIQGLEDYFEDDIKQMVSDYIIQTLNDMGLTDDDISIKDINIYGSRGRGTARDDSDLDVVVEYTGDEREDDLFNALNYPGEELYIDGIKVDINPINAERSGDMDSFMARAKEYDKSKLNEEPINSLKDAIKYAKMAAKKDGYDQTIYKEKDGEWGISRFYDPKTTHKGTTIVGKVVIDYKDGVKSYNYYDMSELDGSNIVNEGDTQKDIEWSQEPIAEYNGHTLYKSLGSMSIDGIDYISYLERDENGNGVRSFILPITGTEDLKAEKKLKTIEESNMEEIRQDSADKGLLEPEAVNEADDSYYKDKCQKIADFMNDLGITPDTIVDNKDVIDDQLNKYDLEMKVKIPNKVWTIGYRTEGFNELGTISYMNIGKWVFNYDPFILKPIEESVITEATVSKDLHEVKSQGNIFMLKDNDKYIVGENYDSKEKLIENAEIYNNKEEADKDYLNRCGIKID